ncbi:MAG: radical SAM protein [Candidatus Omnitrophota bacterium]|nr:radical SAM protein [Candidatus Omnitrophota bacterium]
MNFKRIFPVPVNMSLARAFITFVYSIVLTRVLNRPSKRGPLFVTWLVTYDCNMYCKFCSTHGLKKRFPEQVGAERAKEIARQIIDAKTYSVGFTGGEVLLWPHLFDVIKILKERNVIVYIVTNGLLLREKSDEIIKNKVDYIVVSIDSDKPDEHDSIRNSPGLYEKLENAIKYIKSKRKGRRPLIKSTTVVHKGNIHRLGSIDARLKSLADVTSFQPIVGGYIYGPHNKEAEAMEQFMFRPDEQKNVENIFDRLTGKNSEFNNDYFRLIPRYWFNKEQLAREVRCWSPFLRLQILPNGDVFHCTANINYPSMGNINNLSIRQLWNSPEMIRQREEIRLHKNNCICWAQDTSFNILLNRVPCFKMMPSLDLK